MKRACLIPGSLDPFTNGHLELIKDTLELVDNVEIVIGFNPDKTRNYNINEMKKAIEETLKIEGIKDRCDVHIYEGVIVRKASEIKKEKNYKSIVIMKGLRDGIDFGYESNIRKVNHYIDPSIKTVYMEVNNYEFVSSTTVRNLFKLNENIEPLVSKPVFELMKKKRDEEDV